MFLADILFLAIVVYLAYRFIFNFLLPIVRATPQVRQQFRDMRGSGGAGPGAGGARPGAGGARPGPGGAGTGPGGAQQGAASGGTRSGSGGGKGTYKPPAEDYIDFEEVK
jgi:hypothetical protein